MGLEQMVASANLQGNPIVKLKEFLNRQNNYKKTNEIDKWRFVGYVLELSYEGAKIITNDTWLVEFQEDLFLF